MRTLDLDKELKITQCIAPQTYDPGAGGGDLDGTAIDRSANNSGAIAFVFLAGVVTDGTHTPVVRDSADNVTYADTTSISTALVAFTTSVDEQKQETAYTGVKRYVRPRITAAANATALLACIAIEARGNLPA